MKKPIYQPSVEDIHEISKDKIKERSMEERLGVIAGEFKTGFDFIKKCKNAVSVFGSARSGLGDEVYDEAEKLSFMLSKEGFAIVTGGGPGVMEAANKGAYNAGGRSIGFTIKLPKEQNTNKYVKEEVPFYYFFSRKVMLSFSSKIYIFFPGGFGTMDEFFEILTLLQTGKMENIIIILVGKEYWSPLLKYINDVLYEKGGAIHKEDMDLYHLVDSADEAFKLIESKKEELFENNNN